MEPKFNTSFIPKKSLQADVGTSAKNKYVGRRTVKGPGFYLSLLVFLVSVIASLAVFGYTKIVESAIEGKIALLEDQRDAFDTESINLLTRADTHITSAKKLLEEHVAVSELFSLLEQITLKRVQYTNLEYSGEPNATGGVLVAGAAKNFQDVALQTEQYRKTESLMVPIVRELERPKEVTVEFEVEFSVDQRLTSFSSALKSNRIQPISVPQEAPPATTTPDVVLPATTE